MKRFVSGGSRRPLTEEAHVWSRASTRDIGCVLIGTEKTSFSE
jgi:hypothetical protein